MFFKIHIFISTVFLFFCTLVYGAPPPENTPIGTTAKLSYMGAEIESNLVVTYVVYGDADISVRKEWGVGDSEGNQLMIFRIANGGWRNGKDLLLRDDLKSKYEIVGSTGIWIPFGETEEKIVTLAEDGDESQDKNVNLKYVDGVLTLLVKDVPGHHLESDPGGFVGVYVKPQGDIPAGSILTNIGEYEYFNGPEKITNLKTNSLLYIVPIIAKAEFTGETKEYGISGESFIFKNKLKNIGNTEDIFEISLENNGFPQDSIIGIGKNSNGNFVLLEDKNKNGTVETDSLKPGEEIEIQLKVQTTSSDLTKSNILVEKVAKSLNVPSYSIRVQDKIIKLESSISSAAFIKYQGLDANGDNKIDGEYTENLQKGNPGDKIFYKLVFKNIGTDILKDIYIEDTIPSYTKMSYGDGTLKEGGKPIFKLSDGTVGEVIDKPPAGFNGTLRVNFGHINPGEYIEIYYNVKID